MSNLHAFFAQNAIKRDVEEHAISKSFLDETGKPIKWQLKAIDGKKDTENRVSCTKKVASPKNPNVRIPEMDMNLYMLKNAVSTVVYPNLNDKELQDSYGVMCAEDLIQKMLLPGELQDLMLIAQKINGFNANVEELAEEAKN